MLWRLHQPIGAADIRGLIGVAKTTGRRIRGDTLDRVGGVTNRLASARIGMPASGLILSKKG